MAVRYPKISSGRSLPCTESSEGARLAVGIVDRLIAGCHSTNPTARRIYDSDYDRFRSDSNKP